MLACAEDGWVDDWPDGPPRNWNHRGVRRYQACKIHCLTPDGDLMVARPLMPELPLLQRLVWAAFNRSRPVEVEFSTVGGVSRPLDFFKGELLEALHRDGDLMLQFAEEEELAAAIRQASSYAELREIYRKYHWTD
ncbi:MAG TPA: hypothetical protein VLA37_02100 [Sphingomonadaceae bacterium]|nr:hypothetical protein [Sphingomonadaceae bacterium]